MPTVSIDCDEWYPVYTMNRGGDDYSKTVEFSEAEIVDYELVLAKFDAWQDKLKRAYRESR